jgi:Planctomycete cytochrome C
MMNWKNILFNLTFAANCLLFFLLIFYNRLSVPSILQVLGRAHPLFLHFPIVLFAGFIAWIWIAPKQLIHLGESYDNFSKWLLLITCLAAVMTALMGVLLSKEPIYNEESLFWHKWSGVLISFISFLWYLFFDQLNKRKIVLAFSSLLSIAVLIVAGHQGASITHGDNFLLAPIEKNNTKHLSFDEAFVFADMVKPILDLKCITCHNSKKAKGELIMETKQLLLKGGKSGALWDTADANLSLLLERIHLPLEEKKHMPPSSKAQLTEREIAILYNWIKGGSNFSIKVNQLEPTDTLRTLAQSIFKSSDAEEDFEFNPASEKTILKMNTNYRVVYPLARNSPAIAADFYGAAFFKPEQIKELLEIKTQLVSLNLDKMPVRDNDLEIIGQFTSLRNLNLSFSNITGRGLSSLTKLNHLKNISLTNTPVKKSDIQEIAPLKELRNLYLWNTNVSLADAEELKKRYPALAIQTGVRTDTMFLKINPPTLLTEAQVIVDTPIQLRLKHFVPGVTIRYSMDGAIPDSINSPIYDDKTFINRPGLVKIKAFKKGWHGSEVIDYRFYRATYKADTVIMINPIDSAYKAKGAKIINDFVKGSQDFGDGKWIAFRKNNMQCIMVFSKPIKPKSITISSLVNVGALIFPPKKIKIFGGVELRNLKPLYRIAPAQDTLPMSNYLIAYDCKITPTTVKYIKIIVDPIGKMPKQFLPEKKAKVDSQKKDNKNNFKNKKPDPANDRGWFFIDEIFLN